MRRGINTEPVTPKRVHIHDMCDHATYDRNKDGKRGPKGDEMPCAICGLGTITHGAKTSYWVHMRVDGYLLGHGETVSDDQDFGCHPVGPNCYKRHAALLAGYVTCYKLSEKGMKTEKL